MPFGIGESIGTAYVRIIADGKGLDESIRSQFDDAIDDAHLESAGTRAGRDFTEGFDAEAKKRLGNGPTWKKAVKNLERSMARQVKLQNYFDGPHWKTFVDRAEREFGHVGFVAARSIEQEFIEQGRGLDGVGGEIDRFVSRVQRMRIDIDRETRRAGTPLTRFARRADDFGHRLGRVFGAGARNNFLNLFGRFVGFIPRAISGFIQLGQAATKLGTKLFTAFTEADGGMQGLLAVGKIIGPSLAAGAALAVAAFVALEIAASTASLAVGGLTAIIGTVGSGLIGGITLLAASLVPLAAGIGSVFIAYKSLSDMQKRVLSQDMKPLTNTFESLGNIAAANIFTNLGDSLNRMVPFMNSLATATNVVTGAVRQQIDSWVDLVSSGAFDNFINTISRDLPGQIASMNGVIQNLARGFTGLFSALSPVLSRFLDSLEGVTGRFADFANSVEGSEKIEDFFSSTFESVKSLGRVLVSASKLLGNFFRVGAEGGGNDLFDSLTTTFDNWNEALIENQDSIKAWVQDGADFMRALGDIVVGIVAFTDALDTPFMRTTLLAILEQTAFSFEVLAITIGGTWEALKLLEPLLGPIAQGLGNLGSAVGWLGDKLGFTGDDAEDASGDLKNTAEAADVLKASMVKAKDATSRAGKELRVLGRAADWLQQVRVEGREMADTFDSIATKTKDAKLGLDDWIEGLKKQARAMRNFGDNLRTLAERGLSQEVLNNLKEMGIEGTRIANELVRGGKGKIDEINQATERVGNATTDLKLDWAKAKTALEDPIKMKVEAGDALDDVHSVKAAIDGVHDKEVRITAKLAIERTGEAIGAALGRFGNIFGASGGTFTSPTSMIIGEAGPEALVPLRRPLGKVDPSVRGLSAIAQGLAVPGGTGGGRTLNVGPITVNTPTTDPRAVAVETVNRLALVGGF